MDSDSSEQQCKELTKCNSYHSNKYFQSYPFVFAQYHSPCQDSKKCSSMPPKTQDRAYFSLVSLSPRSRSRRGKKGERRARGVEADPRRERSKRRKKSEILKCRDSDIEADTVKQIFPTHGLGLVTYDLIYIYSGVYKVPLRDAGN